jgi:hypothetical protein
MPQCYNCVESLEVMEGKITTLVIRQHVKKIQNVLNIVGKMRRNKFRTEENRYRQVLFRC